MKYALLRILTGVLLTFICTTSSHARLPYLALWDDIYPDSTSDDASCQLCHQDAAGGQPWNAYGWAIKFEFVNGGGSLTISEAIENVFVTAQDSDSDPFELTNDKEITENFQPGWTEGANNTVYFCSDCDDISGLLQNMNPLAAQSPPTGLPASIRFDAPVEITNPLPDVPLGAATVALEDVDDGSNAENFVAPNYAAPAPGLDDYLFVVDQVGYVWQVNLASGSKTKLLDVSDQICNLSTSYDERGLLGLAFHPDFANNGFFYTYQSEGVTTPTSCGGSDPNHRSVVREWLANTPGSADLDVSEVYNREVIAIDQPQFNHNGGMMAFSPTDGYLYISVGDGGGAEDEGAGHSEGGNGQDTANLLGSILRIDPLVGATTSYTIPAGNDPDNVFDADEIFAYGFRNVWRFSFDSTGNLYAGDVGQYDIEEVSLVENGKNYGWSVKEGSLFFYNNGSDRGYVTTRAPVGAPTDLVDPILEYDHGDGVSVIGGYLYEGSELTGLTGTYIFGEYTRKLFYSSDLETIQQLRIQGQNDLGFLLMGIGRDANGELYAMGRPNNSLVTDPSNQLGVLKKIVPIGPVDPGDPNGDICFPIVGTNGATAVVCL